MLSEVHFLECWQHQHQRDIIPGHHRFPMVHTSPQWSSGSTLRWNLNSVPSNPSISFVQGPYIKGVFLSHVATKGWWAVERIIGLCSKGNDFALWVFRTQPWVFLQHVNAIRSKRFTWHEFLIRFGILECTWSFYYLFHLKRPGYPWKPSTQLVGQTSPRTTIRKLRRLKFLQPMKGIAQVLDSLSLSPSLSLSAFVVAWLLVEAVLNYNPVL